jgi:hypothetical protein
MSAPDRDGDETPAPDSLTPSERRLGFRYLSCFPAHLERPGDSPRAAMIRDLSVSGALLVVRTTLSIGDTVRLRLFITGDTNVWRDVVARVVRIEKLEDPFSGPWSSRVALQFDDELAGVDSEIAALAKRQAEVLGSSK